MARRADRRARARQARCRVGPSPPAARRRRRLLAQRRVQAARAVLRLRAIDRVPACAGVERDGERARTMPSWPLLADPAWRARARHEWDNRPHVATSRVDRPHSLIFAISETGAGPLGISLADYARQTSLHVSDALAEWLRAQRHRFVARRHARRARRGRRRRRCCAIPRRSPTSTTAARICSCSAAPARTCTCSRTTCATRASSRIEEAVHSLTGRSAAFFGLHRSRPRRPGQDRRPRGVRTRRDRAAPRDAGARCAVRDMALHPATGGFPGDRRAGRPDVARRCVDGSASGDRCVSPFTP